MAERAVVVATAAAGRHRHLARQAHAVAQMAPAPDGYVVVSLDAEPHDVPGARVLHTPAPAGEPLPVGAARNTGIAAAGDDALVVWLDVDCLPAPDLVPHVRAAAQARPQHLISWPVGRLGPLPDDRLAPTAAELDAARDAAREQGRPVPPPGTVVDEARAVLFWSLAFAVGTGTHARIGGFDPGFAGYGAEDTDYALRAQEAGVGFAWAGGAWAHHQHHPVSSPPVEHLDDIVRNARRFHARWGRWPMEGWLAAFARDGLVAWTPEGDTLERVVAGAQDG